MYDNGFFFLPWRSRPKLVDVKTFFAKTVKENVTISHENKIAIYLIYLSVYTAGAYKNIGL